MNRAPVSTTRYILPLILYCALIFFLSSLHHPPVPEYGVEWSDKINHTLAYTVMLLAAFRGTRLLPYHSQIGSALKTAILFTLLYGASDEYHQSFVPGRSCEIADWYADATGALVGSIIVLLTVHRPLGKLLFGSREPADA